KVIEDVASKRLLSLDTQGDPYFFEMDIKDPLKENNSVCYYRISLKDPFSSIKTDKILSSRGDFYVDRKLTFAASTQGLDLPYEGLDIAPVLQGSSLEAFLAEHTLAYTAIPFSFERMAKDVRMGGNFPETVAGKVSVHGYSKTGRKLFSTPWLTRNSIEEPLSWWCGVE
ncbi:hypothetical protein HX867_34470, partial [Pseudomonas gingeri]|nr:hypothetical protein [Pseudomonas gingeri]